MIRDQLAITLRSLGDPTRLAIVNTLMQGTHCNCEISDKLGLSASLISHHMRVLTELGLIIAERQPQDRRWIYYRINPSAVAELTATLTTLFDPARIQPRDPLCCIDGSSCSKGE